MIKAKITFREFIYRRPATTSRGTYASKPVYYIVLRDELRPELTGVGECSLFPGLSPDDVPGFYFRLDRVASEINSASFNWDDPLIDWPSIRFGLETALNDLRSGGKRLLYPSDFTRGKAPMRVNGLIWMDSPEGMRRQVREKLDAGFRCLKMKIGAVGIAEELDILSGIRKEFAASDLELRVDANGAFASPEVPALLEKLARLGVHSIEQPIRAGLREEMARLCEDPAIPIALDESLIGLGTPMQKKKLLEEIDPQYIILKPGLLGGIDAAKEWVELARGQGTGFWVTSALETNVGLNAIAQWAYTLGIDMPQGLSTGSLFAEPIPSPLHIEGELLFHDPGRKWDLTDILPEP